MYVETKTAPGRYGGENSLSCLLKKLEESQEKPLGGGLCPKGFYSITLGMPS